jgi:hypothetical protein
VRLVAEAGFFGVLSNEAAFGRDASTIDFRKAAGQDNLQLYTRWSAELDLGRRHTFVFLIQPLSTEGTRTPSVDERFEDVTFRAGGPVRTRFSFPFYRLSYLYEVLQGERWPPRARIHRTDPERGLHLRTPRRQRLRSHLGRRLRSGAEGAR